jgi:cephalosporin-C deacetylase
MIGATALAPEIAAAGEFDATHGHDLPALLRVGAPPEPADFADFWRASHAAAREVPVNATVEGEGPGTAQWRVLLVRFSSTEGSRLGGWLVLPRQGPVRQGVVVGHGYGGRAEPALAECAAGSATLFFCSRGFDRSATPAVPGLFDEHVVHGIARRDSYAHRGAAADVWSSASALLELVPETAGRLLYAGGSFGGGIGALALPWDPRFAGAHLDVPSFGNHPLRVTLRCTGSGEAVRRHVAAHPEALQVLAYFDAATAARHLRIPTHVSAALFDPAVPPAGQFAVFNSLAGPRRLFVRQAGHLQHPGLADEDREVLQDWQHWLAAGDAHR